MRLYAQLDSENNRYNMVFDYDVENLKFNQQWGRYCPGIMIEARAGMSIDGYADGSRSCFRAMGMANFVNGNSDRSISNMACGQNVIVVGSCNSRDKVPLMNGAEIDVTESVGTVSKFSGYGTLADGRSLPHVCAPGNMVISSISGAYIEQQNDDIRSKVVAVVDDGMRQHHWYALNGTSMSSPYAAGVYALWLQADPTLTVDEIREITIATADRSAADIADPRWGSGRLNALAGMKEVLSRTNIDAVDSVNDVIVSNDGCNQFVIQSLTHAVEQVKIYGLDGVAVLADKYDSDYVTVDMSAMPAGVYLMEIVSGGKRYIRRIMVR
jgi:subtilisin family serine protease